MSDQGFGWRLRGLGALLLAVVFTLPGCGQEGGAEGTTGRFRLLNRSKEKPITEVKVYKRVKTSEGPPPVYAWEEVTAGLKQQKWISGTSAVQPNSWFKAHWEAGEMAFTYGVKVEYQMEGDTEWRVCALDESDWNGEGRNPAYIILDVRRGGLGAATLHVTRGTDIGMSEAAGEGFGRLRVHNNSGESLTKLELHARVDIPSVGLQWVPVHDYLIDDPVAAADDLENGKFYAGHVPHRFHSVRGVKVIWRTESDSADNILAWRENMEPFMSAEQAVGAVVLTLYADGASRIGRGQVRLPKLGTVLERVKSVP